MMTGALLAGGTHVTESKTAPSCAGAFSAENASVAARIRHAGVTSRTARSTRARSERVCWLPLVTAIHAPPAAKTHARRRRSAEVGGFFEGSAADQGPQSASVLPPPARGDPAATRGRESRGLRALV